MSNKLEQSARIEAFLAARQWSEYGWFFAGVSERLPDAEIEAGTADYGCALVVFVQRKDWRRSRCLRGQIPYRLVETGEVRWDGYDVNGCEDYEHEDTRADYCQRLIEDFCSS